MSRRSHGFCFTLNNYTDSDEKVLEKVDCTYIVYGKEEAPSTGTPHLQGYVYFKSNRGLPGVIAALPRRCHVEPARGTALQNYEYCSKSGVICERGERPADKRRRDPSGSADYALALKLARAGDFENIDPMLFTRYYSTYLKIRSAFLQSESLKPLDQLPGEFYYGPSGTGKSLLARQLHPNAYIKNCNKWWDGYTGQDTVIIDDISPPLAKALCHHIKNWVDHYPFTAEVKGGSLFIRPKIIIMTSNYDLKTLFEDEYDFVKRRFRVSHFIAKFTCSIFRD